LLPTNLSYLFCGPRSFLKLIRPFLVCVCIATLGAACIPFPHYQHNYPKISGTLTLNGAPLKSTKVYVQHNGAPSECPEPEQEQITDKEGRFFFDESAEFLFFMMFGDRKDGWTVCVQLEEGSRYGWSSEGYWGGPKTQELVCELVLVGSESDRKTSLECKPS